ncbi:hypothetical protein Desti_1612 [Desulfomonile tiedjei DSM 6799]|uniref:Uncharacterized protein n=1 Tax=Desulfomonile tiedjei (strain ATCC 49306 / DSM 6799 / DCB-1) TaxID=706587 RepID=I4C432_DESTA|nr:hypothetical protein Desti_1612 [Desulfomonile tiedjei DSM 6799]
MLTSVLYILCLRLSRNIIVLALACLRLTAVTMCLKLPQEEVKHGIYTLSPFGKKL